jgi:hypothetical protein
LSAVKADAGLFADVQGRLRTALGSRRAGTGRQNDDQTGAPVTSPPVDYVAILSPSGYEEYVRKVADHVARTAAVPDAHLTADLMAE